MSMECNHIKDPASTHQINTVNRHGEGEGIQRQEEAPNTNNAIIDLVVLQSFVVLKFVAMSCTVVY